MSTVETILQLVGAVLVTLVTDWSLLALRVLQEVAALPHLAEHHGLPLPVIGTEDVVRLGVTVGAVPVVPGGLENSHYETSRGGVELQTCSCSGRGRSRAPGGCSPPPGLGADSLVLGWCWSWRDIHPHTLYREVGCHTPHSSHTRASQGASTDSEDTSCGDQPHPGTSST